MKTSLIALLVLCAACASSRPREYKLDSDGFKTDGADWVLEPVPGTDKMMPDGWERVSQPMRDREVVEMRFKRVQLDGSVSIFSWKLIGDDQRKSLRALSERELTGFRLGSGSLLFGTVEPAKPVLVDGAEAQEGTYEMRRRDDYAPVTRVYASFAKSIANDSFVSVFYLSPPGQFDEGLPAVQSLIRRLRFLQEQAKRVPGKSH